MGRQGSYNLVYLHEFIFFSCWLPRNILHNCAWLLSCKDKSWSPEFLYKLSQSYSVSKSEYNSAWHLLNFYFLYFFSAMFDIYFCADSINYWPSFPQHLSLFEIIVVSAENDVDSMLLGKFTWLMLKAVADSTWNCWCPFVYLNVKQIRIV